MRKKFVPFEVYTNILINMVCINLIQLHEPYETVTDKD